jgi:hypothetical protein
VDVVVEVGGREHECCGEAIERFELVTFGCLRDTGPDGGPRLVETHHHLEAEELVQGLVTEIHLVREGDTPQPILRIPSGRALRGFDDADDGHLEDPWTVEVVTSDVREFLVTVRTSR